MKTIQEILANPNPNAVDFLDTIKLNLFAMEIFVFTPKGDIKTLPQGATALDFAYMLHSDIGDNCLGAKVNHKLIPLSKKLNSGDQVEIITSTSQKPQPEWLNFVTTAKARTKIEAALRREKRKIAKEGKLKLDKLFIEEPNMGRNMLDRILHYYNIDRKEDLFYQIGNNEIELPQDYKTFFKDKSKEQTDNLLLRYMKQAYKAMRKTSDDNAKEKTERETKKDEVENLFEIKKIDRKQKFSLMESNQIKNFIVPSCCNPLPGDDVFGFITENEKVEVHQSSCQVWIKLKSNYGDRILEVVWGDYKQYTFKSSVSFTGIDKKGILNLIIAKISEDVSVNILSMNISAKDGIFEGHMDVSVHSLKDVQNLCSMIAKVDGINTVHRSTT